MMIERSSRSATPEPVLWQGAQVRVVGRPRLGRSRQLRVGTRGVVVDAGPHQLPTFGVAGDPASDPAASRRNVLIRLAPGTQHEIPGRYLELVTGDHPLAPQPDTARAAWFTDQLEPVVGRLVASHVPRSLPAVAVVLPPFRAERATLRWAQLARADDVGGQQELAELVTAATSSVATSRGAAPRPASPQDVTVPESLQDVSMPLPGELDRASAAALVELLDPATTTPDAIDVAVWDGWPDVPSQRFPGAGSLRVAERMHLLLSGPLEGVMTPVSVAPTSDRWGDGPPASGIWWPDDHAWLVVSPVDLPWSYVAGDHTLIERIVAATEVEARRTTHDASLDGLPAS